MHDSESASRLGVLNTDGTEIRFLAWTVEKYCLNDNAVFFILYRPVSTAWHGGPSAQDTQSGIAYYAQYNKPWPSEERRHPFPLLLLWTTRVVSIFEDMGRCRAYTFQKLNAACLLPGWTWLQHFLWPCVTLLPDNRKWCNERSGREEAQMETHVCFRRKLNTECW